MTFTAVNETTGPEITQDSAEQLTIFSELPDIDFKKSGITDTHINFKFIDYNHLFGLRAGVYSSKELPASLKVIYGYFGGFQIDKNKIISPIKGMAPDERENRTSPLGSLPGDSSSYQSTPSATPNISGSDWSGYFKYGYSSDKIQLTATVSRNGTVVTITTSKSGIAHYLAGTINSYGDMLIYDSYDKEDWTTHFGPATSTSINLYDYAWPPQPGQPEPPLNKLILTRPSPVPPSIPTNVQASDGTLQNAILVSWNNQERTNFFQVYSCEDSTTSSCSLKSNSTVNHYTDTIQEPGKIYYRIKACNNYGCSAFSTYNTGYKKIIPLSFLHLLLGG